MAKFETVVVRASDHRLVVRSTLKDRKDSVSTEYELDVSDDSGLAKRAASNGLAAVRLATIRANAEAWAVDHAELLAREKLLDLRHGKEDRSPGPQLGRAKTARESDREQIDASRTSKRRN
jgi:hypothetical protein